MPSYNIYLGDVGSGLDYNKKNDIQNTLQGWFNQIVPPRSAAIVSWTSSTPSPITSTDMLVYFVESDLHSVVRSMPGGRRRSGIDAGFTVWTNVLTASEVYVAENENWLAQVAFHELMHNKTHLGDSLHTHDGLASTSVGVGAAPTPQNIALMRHALTNRHQQWADGWSARVTF